MTSMRLLAACLLMVSWPSAGAGEGAGPVGRVRVCPVTTLSVEGRVNRLSVHPDSRILSYTYAGEIGRRGGFRAIDYASGAQVDAVPSRTEPHVDALVSPSGRRLAFVHREKSSSTLKIGALDGSQASACAPSAKALAFSADEQVVIGTTSRGNEHRIVVCDATGGMTRSWANTTVLERLKEGATPRLHGRPQWMVGAAAVSRDAKRILTIRYDGQITLWDSGGARLDDTQVPFTLDLLDRRVVFTEAGEVLLLSHGFSDVPGNARLEITGLFPERKRFEALREPGINSTHGTDHAYLYATRRGPYLLFLRRSGVAIVNGLDGETIAEVPAGEPVAALAVDSDGTTVAVAHPGRVMLWRLVKDPGTCG